MNTKHATPSRFTASLPPPTTCTNCGFTYYDTGAPHLCKEWGKATKEKTKMSSLFEGQSCAVCQYPIDSNGMCVIDANHKTGATIQCSSCPNHETLGGEITEQAMVDDGWLLGETVFCPKHGPDEGEV